MKRETRICVVVFFSILFSSSSPVLHVINHHHSSATNKSKPFFPLTLCPIFGSQRDIGLTANFHALISCSPSLSSPRPHSHQYMTPKRGPSRPNKFHCYPRYPFRFPTAALNLSNRRIEDNAKETTTASLCSVVGSTAVAAFQRCSIGMWRCAADFSSVYSICLSTLSMWCGNISFSIRNARKV
jgi:hypothetical protein